MFLELLRFVKKSPNVICYILPRKIFYMLMTNKATNNLVFFSTVIKFIIKLIILYFKI